MLKIKNSISLNELYKFKFVEVDSVLTDLDCQKNNNYLIRYIPDNDECRMTKIEHNMPYFRSLYVDKTTRKLFAYNDYNDEKIRMQKEWIADLINAGLLEKTKKGNKRMPKSKNENLSQNKKGE